MVILFAMSNIAFGADSIKSDSLYKENRLKNDKPKTFDELDLTCREIVAKTDNGVELKTQITESAATRFWTNTKNPTKARQSTTRILKMLSKFYSAHYKSRRKSQKSI